MLRRISYAAAINEAFIAIMREKKEAFHIGVGINTPWFVGNTMTGLLEEFGPDRVIDTPVSENGVTGLAIGAALAGMHPILTFPRMDFMHYAMDQLVNHGALLPATLGGRVKIPILVRAIINRGGEQGAQHSQALQGVFMHFPGFKVVMPSHPYDAKGMLLQAMEETDPVIFIDDRWLYDEQGEVPASSYRSDLDRAEIVREGTDLTVVASSYTVVLCRETLESLPGAPSVELIDLRSIKPIDSACLLRSVAKTGRLLVVDATWPKGGVAAEICRIVATEGFASLKKPIAVISLPDAPAPAAHSLEEKYYPRASDITAAIETLIG
ncbi:MAG: hypothetical protein JXD23_15940 [Spirochaetales bacterium]|nr:hypothetical protein [Spirochaetales bacterium]